jgi:uncharacterized protein involved in copper resistance
MNKPMAAVALFLASSTTAFGQSPHTGHPSTDPVTTDHATMDHTTMHHMPTGDGDTDGMSHKMAGALGSYSMSRERRGPPGNRTPPPMRACKGALVTGCSWGTSY